MGSMKKIPNKKKNDFSFESSEVTHLVSFGTNSNNLSVRLWREWRKKSEEGLI
jgi:hypothetical protein